MINGEGKEKDVGGDEVVDICVGGAGVCLLALSMPDSLVLIL